MKATVVLKKLLAGACVYYTAISLAVLLAAALLGGDLEGSVSAVNHLLLFPFGLALSGGGMLLHSRAMRPGVRLLLHYLITLAAFFCFLWLPSRAGATAGAVFAALLGLSLAYWLICLIVILTRRRFRSFKEE